MLPGIQNKFIEIEIKNTNITNIIYLLTIND